MARRLSAQCHQVGLTAPGFRSPPRSPEVSRTFKRFPDGSVIVAIRLHGRHRNEVLGDMIDGILMVNGLRAGRAEKMRTTLQWAVTSQLPAAA